MLTGGNTIYHTSECYPKGSHLSLNKKPENWQFYAGNYKNVFNYPSPLGILFLLKFLSDGIWYFMEIYITLSRKYFFSTVCNEGFIVCMLTFFSLNFYLSAFHCVLWWSKRPLNTPWSVKQLFSMTIKKSLWGNVAKLLKCYKIF